MRTLALALCCLFLAGPLSGCRTLMIQAARRAAEPEPIDPPDDIAVERDIVFATTADGPLALDVYTPKAKGEEPLPVVVYVHGGGWFAGNKHQIQVREGYLLTRRGYAVVATSYRLSDVAHFPAQIHDVKAAVRWVRANASAFGFDRDRIGAWGGSAGGHLVALLATTNGDAGLEGEVGGVALSGHSSDVAAVVDYFGPTNLMPDDARPESLSWMIDRLLGGAASERPALAGQASPVLHVSASAAPLLIVHGTDDPVVPYTESTSFHALLQSTGADATLRPVNGGGHGTGGDFDAGGMIDEVGAFFDRHLKR